MSLRDLTDEQLERVYRRLYDRLAESGPFGWDWPTLRVVNPGLYKSLKEVYQELRQRV
jgi:hypothetical protein